MGLLSGILGKKQEEHPPLDPASAAATRLSSQTDTLADLLKRANDRLEAIPTDHGLYVYVGKPPKEFGVVWYKDGEEHSFMSVMKEKGLSGDQVQDLSDALRDVYTAHIDEPRYSYPVGDKKVVVTPSEALAVDLEGVIGALGF
ncbi:MAG: hypothetical protein KKA32_01895 [Actinobacteria bacterium]|nr:hypothetical protein [Actinomycetota bacterium]